MKKYKVILAISVGVGKEEKSYMPGAEVELNDEIADHYRHALIAVEKPVAAAEAGEEN